MCTLPNVIVAVLGPLRHVFAFQNIEVRLLRDCFIYFERQPEKTNQSSTQYMFQIKSLTIKTGKDWFEGEAGE